MPPTIRSNQRANSNSSSRRHRPFSLLRLHPEYRITGITRDDRAVQDTWSTALDVSPLHASQQRRKIATLLEVAAFFRCFAINRHILSTISEFSFFIHKSFDFNGLRLYYITIETRKGLWSVCGCQPEPAVLLSREVRGQRSRSPLRHLAEGLF